MTRTARYTRHFAPWTALGALAFTLACGGSHSTATATQDAGPWPSAPTAVAYAGKYGTLTPTAIVGTPSGVTGSANATNGGTLMLTAPASIVLDYGQVVGGHPQWEVVSYTGSPVLNAIYTESSNYLASGDQKPYIETSLEPSRNSSYSITGTGAFTNTLLQGGERYQTLSLATSGATLTLKGIGIQADLAAPNVTADSAGYFTSSDATLNAIWQAGAYAAEANRVDKDTLPSPWTPQLDSVLVGPSNPVYYQGFGLNAKGSVTQFEFQVIQGGISWIVNASFNSTVEFTLDATAGTLSASAGGSFNDSLRLPVLSATALPEGWATAGSGGWHTLVTTSDSAGALTVTLDGTTVVTGLQPGDTIDPVFGLYGLPYLPEGSSGIYNTVGSSDYVKNFSITATDATTGLSLSYASALASGDTSFLDDFAMGTNRVSCVTDGAKRDRQIWSGDMLVAAPTIYYSTGNAEPIQGSLDLLSQYVDSEGQVASTLPPKSPLDSLGRLGAPMNPWYGLDYSMFYIDVIHDYYLHTGDLTRLSQWWPTILKELDYLKSQKDSNNLLATNYATGWNWHPQYDMVLTGEVTEFNLDYVRALRHAAVLATALGWSTDATTLSTQADTVAAAINANLFNGTYYDMSSSRVGSGYIAQDANSKAVAYGVAASDKVAGILSTLDDSLDPNSSHYGHWAFSSNYFTDKNGGVAVISPFVSNVEVLARLEQGDTDAALTLLLQTWGRMVDTTSAFYSGATWESMAGTGYPNTSDPSVSLAHAWSSGPTATLSAYVLGVRPVTAGFKTWLVQPQMSTISWASGRVPTPYGPITFKWAQNYGSTPFRAELTVPAGTTGTVAVPVVSGAQVVKVNGAKVTPGSAYTLGALGTSSYLPVTISTSGTYTIETSKD